MRLTIQYFIGNPTMCRIPELDIRTMPDCEGGGWWISKEMGEFLVECVNGYVDSAVDEASPLSSWAELVVYWKERAERAERYASALENMLPDDAVPDDTVMR